MNKLLAAAALAVSLTGCQTAITNTVPGPHRNGLYAGYTEALNGDVIKVAGTRFHLARVRIKHADQADYMRYVARGTLDVIVNEQTWNCYPTGTTYLGDPEAECHADNALRRTHVNLSDALVATGVAEYR